MLVAGMLIGSAACAANDPYAPAVGRSLVDRATHGNAAGTMATAVFNVLIPAHPPLPRAPQFISPATAAIGFSVVATGRQNEHFFFSLTPRKSYCTRGTPEFPLSCRLTLRVPASKDTFVVDTYDGTSKRSSILANGSVTEAIAANTDTTINLSLDGAVAFLQVALADPFPPRGARATIPVSITAADAYGFVIVGRYSTPIALTDSDGTGVTRLSAHEDHRFVGCRESRPQILRRESSASGSDRRNDA